MKLRLSDWDHLTRILLTATRSFDFYVTRKCAALDARSDERIRKQATHEDRTSETRFRTTPYRLCAEGQYFVSPSEILTQQWGLPHNQRKSRAENEITLRLLRIERALIYMLNYPRLISKFIEFYLSFLEL